MTLLLLAIGAFVLYLVFTRILAPAALAVSGTVIGAVPQIRARAPVDLGQLSPIDLYP